MQLINGKALAASIRERVKQDIETQGLHPKLAVLLVGDDPASEIYVKLKEKAAQEAGIATDIRRLPAMVSDTDLKQIISDWNSDENVDAILVQLPLPPGHDADDVISAIDPAKDVDGFHPENASSLLAGEALIFPPVHESILRLIGAAGTDMRSAKAVIIANSDTFAEPLAHLLTTAGCFVETYSPEDLDVRTTQQADIIVIAIGRPNFLTRDLIKSGACIIDVGTNRVGKKTVGDVDVEHIQDIPGWLSPVPGGVGPMTVALLLKNVLELAKRRR